MTAEEIRIEAERRPLRERGALISRLILSLGDPAYDVDDEEVSLRVRETESREVEDISHEELLARLKHLPKR